MRLAEGPKSTRGVTTPCNQQLTVGSSEQADGKNVRRNQTGDGANVAGDEATSTGQSPGSREDPRGGGIGGNIMSDAVTVAVNASHAVNHGQGKPPEAPTLPGARPTAATPPATSAAGRAARDRRFRLQQEAAGRVRIQLWVPAAHRDWFVETAKAVCDGAALPGSAVKPRPLQVVKVEVEKQVVIERGLDPLKVAEAFGPIDRLEARLSNQVDLLRGLSMAIAGAIVIAIVSTGVAVFL